MKIPHKALAPYKHSGLGLFSIAAVLTLMIVVIFNWIHKVDILSTGLSILAHTSFLIWGLVTWWSLYHLSFQVWGLLYDCPDTCTMQSAAQPHPAPLRVAILYLTCDDFQVHSCLSCVRQLVPDLSSIRVFICDDSTTPERIAEVDRFCQVYTNVKLLRREDKAGYKAGNLNYAFSHESVKPADWIVVADSDQTLPDDYLHRLVPVLTAQPEQVAYVQTANASDHRSFMIHPGKTELQVEGVTVFQAIMGTEIQLYYERTLPLRQRFGFVPFLGHGAAIRARAWSRVEGFPKVVSEDYAFSMKVRGCGMYGVYDPYIVSFESFPFDFSAFVIRLRKFSAGTAELLQPHLKEFLKCGATPVEKLDLVMCISWYPLMLCVFVNLFLSAFVCSVLWERKIGMLHPSLPFVFTGMFLLTLAVVVSLRQSVFASIRYWFWSVAIYNACLPVAVWHFVTHLRKSATFERTPKRGCESGVSCASCVAIGALGVVAWVLSGVWQSPFSPLLQSYAVSFFLFGAFTLLNDPGWRGAFVRILVFVPGLLTLEALREMWLWGQL